MIGYTSAVYLVGAFYIAYKYIIRNEEYTDGPQLSKYSDPTPRLRRYVFARAADFAIVVMTISTTLLAISTTLNNVNDKLDKLDSIDLKLDKISSIDTKLLEIALSITAVSVRLFSMDQKLGKIKTEVETSLPNIQVTSNAAAQILQNTNYAILASLEIIEDRLTSTEPFNVLIDPTLPVRVDVINSAINVIVGEPLLVEIDDILKVETVSDTTVIIQQNNDKTVFIGNQPIDVDVISVPPQCCRFADDRPSEGGSSGDPISPDAPSLGGGGFLPGSSSPGAAGGAGIGAGAAIVGTVVGGGASGVAAGIATGGGAAGAGVGGAILPNDPNIPPFPPGFPGYAPPIDKPIEGGKVVEWLYNIYLESYYINRYFYFVRWFGFNVTNVEQLPLNVLNSKEPINVVVDNVVTANVDNFPSLYDVNVIGGNVIVDNFPVNPEVSISGGTIDNILGLVNVSINNFPASYDVSVLGGDINVINDLIVNVNNFPANTPVTLTGGVLDTIIDPIEVNVNSTYPFDVNVLGGSISVSNDLKVDTVRRILDTTYVSVNNFPTVFPVDILNQPISVTGSLDREIYSFQRDADSTTVCIYLAAWVNAVTPPPLGGNFYQHLKEEPGGSIGVVRYYRLRLNNEDDFRCFIKGPSSSNTTPKLYLITKEEYDNIPSKEIEIKVDI